MELRDEAGTVFLETVNLMWVGNPKEPELFLAFRCSDPEVVRDALQVHKGKHASDSIFRRVITSSNCASAEIEKTFSTEPR